jgi:hypothetical protein
MHQAVYLIALNSITGKACRNTVGIRVPQERALFFSIGDEAYGVVHAFERIRDGRREKGW